MKKKDEKKIQELTDAINKFIEDIKEKHKIAVENGRKAIQLNSKSQIDFWIVQYKLTDQYEHQAREMLGQLDIARYSSEMRISANNFFNCMGSMAKQLSKVFGYTSIKNLEKNFDKHQLRYEEAKEKNQDLIEETADRFGEMQERMAESNDDVNVSEEERNKIISEFNRPTTSRIVNDDDLMKKIFG